MNYKRATIWASLMYLLLPVAFFLMAIIAMMSPDWDTNDSGAVQGFAYMAVASLAGLVCVIFAFPLIARKLQPSFSARKWVCTNILAIWLVCFILSCVFWALAGSTSASSIINNAISLSLLQTIVALVLLAPAMFVWLRAAKGTHNKLNQQGPTAGTR